MYKIIFIFICFTALLFANDGNSLKKSLDIYLGNIKTSSIEEVTNVSRVIGIIEFIKDESNLIETQKKYICISEHVTKEQLVLVIKKYLEEHPQNLHYKDTALCMIALAIAFPCAQ